VIIILSSITISVLSWFLDLQYHLIASDVTAFISIAIAVYMAALALPLSTEVAEYMKSSDKKLPHKTRMGVLCKYLKRALVVGFLGIITGCASSLIENKTIVNPNGDEELQFPIIYKIFSSLGFGLFIANIIFAWIIFKYIISAVLNGNNLKR
jgi:hypothetical protein